MKLYFLVLMRARLTIKEATVDKTGEVSQAKQMLQMMTVAVFVRSGSFGKFHKKIRAKPDDVRETGERE